MSLKANATLVLSGVQRSDDGINLTFTCSDPGAGEASLWEVQLTDVEAASVSTNQEIRSLVIAKLQRKFRSDAVLTRLVGFIGQSVVI